MPLRAVHPYGVEKDKLLQSMKIREERCRLSRVGLRHACARLRPTPGFAPQSLRDKDNRLPISPVAHRATIKPIYICHLGIGRVDQSHTSRPVRAVSDRRHQRICRWVPNEEFQRHMCHLERGLWGLHRRYTCGRGRIADFRSRSYHREQEWVSSFRYLS